MEDFKRAVLLVGVVAALLPIGLAVLFSAGRLGFFGLGALLVAACTLLVLSDRRTDGTEEGDGLEPVD